jgi:hypothetical protein
MSYAILVFIEGRYQRALARQSDPLFNPTFLSRLCVNARMASVVRRGKLPPCLAAGNLASRLPRPGTKPIRLGLHPMGDFHFEPIIVNASAPAGECVLRTFDDVGAFILINVHAPRRQQKHWDAVRQDLAQARFGARRAAVHAAMREALATEGWLAD